MNNIQKQVNELIKTQLQEWDLAHSNYEGLKNARKKHIQLTSEVAVYVQFNPKRIYSSSAKVDTKSISERKCFLCPTHLPVQQKSIPFGSQYLILVNPFPIFSRHLTIPVKDHLPQLIEGRFGDMLDLARELDEFEVFYNGAKCGASAPDHFHFQAGNKGFMPILNDFKTISPTIIRVEEDTQALYFDNYLRKCIVLHGNNKKLLTSWFELLFKIMNNIARHETEPMMNIVASYQGSKWSVFIFPRRLHRPWQYFEEGENQILLSPASVDLGGALITPREGDFTKIQPSDIVNIFEQVTWTDNDFKKLIQSFSK